MVWQLFERSPNWLPPFDLLLLIFRLLERWVYYYLDEISLPRWRWLYCTISFEKKRIHFSVNSSDKKVEYSHQKPHVFRNFFLNQHYDYSRVKLGSITEQLKSIKNWNLMYNKQSKQLKMNFLINIFLLSYVVYSESVYSTHNSSNILHSITMNSILLVYQKNVNNRFNLIITFYVNCKTIRCCGPIKRRHRK